MDKQFSQACENNKQPIGAVLVKYLIAAGKLLEIGSGTGQHAAHFAKLFPQIEWQPSDLTSSHPSIEAWRRDSGASNLRPVIELDIRQPPTMDTRFDYLYSANTLHIMAWETVTMLFQQLPRYLQPEALVFFYGPFKYQGAFTTDSNAQFDLWLKSRGEHQGIRDFEAIEALANEQGLQLLEDIAMPANNQLLVWRYSAASSS